MRKTVAVLIGLLIVAACSEAAVKNSDSTGDLTGPCADAGVPPSTLECAGLYSDFAAKTLADGVEPYAPATPLWSDGAEKERWIQLPPGQKIDVKNPNEWVFPVGTKLFKQFTYRGKKVETRLFQKTKPNFWVHATYKWNADDSATTISFGETIPFTDEAGATPWVIPAPEDCDSCHRGRTDRILGFEAVNLGLQGATGLTLDELAKRGLLSAAPPQTSLRIGDDGTGFNAPALAWLHTNCGLTCHNSNENAIAYGAKMVLRLDPAWLDGTPPTSTWDPLRTTVGVPAVSGSLAGTPRIAPGDPEGSAIFQLIHQRGELQMPPPPLSRLVDTADVANVAVWILHLQGQHEDDAGAGDAGNDAAAPDAKAPDAEGPVGPIVDAGPPIDGGDAGTLCGLYSVEETESDDTPPGNAIPNTGGSFCGTISSAADVDYMTFTMPDNATKLVMTQTSTNVGAIKVEATADGTPFDFAGVYPIKNGKPYVLKISSATGATFDYVIDVQITTP
jgi:hypothetical protein